MEPPQGSHTVKETERGNRQLVVPTATAAALRTEYPRRALISDTGPRWVKSQRQPGQSRGRAGAWG